MASRPNPFRLADEVAPSAASPSAAATAACAQFPLRKAGSMSLRRSVFASDGLAASALRQEGVGPSAVATASSAS